MSFRLKAISAVVLSAALFSSAYAAGLGKITVLSNLGQPLEAEIELQAASKEEANALTVKLASPDIFHMANIQYNPALNSLRFAVTERNGRPIVRVTSGQPINDLYLDLLVEVEGNGSQLIREYSVMLDPPNLRKPQPVQIASSPAGSAPSPAQAEPVPAPALASKNEAPATKQGVIDSPHSPTPEQAPAAKQEVADSPYSPTPEQLAAAAAAVKQANAEMKADAGKTAVPKRASDTLPQAGSPQASESPADAAAKPAMTKPAPAGLPQNVGVENAVTDEYKVERGDTLSKIARQVKPEGVSLDQMLVALQRANPKAFDGDNMNRLRSGQILAIPDAENASAIKESEARRIVVTQAADFAAYKERLAGQVAIGEAQQSETGRQSAAGKISTQVEEQKNAVNDAKDKLKLSKSGVAAGEAGKAGVMPVSAEERIAKEKALAEANSRIEELEKNISGLQKLLELKNQDLAEKQAQLETAAASAKQPAAPEKAGTAAPLTASPIAPIVAGSPQQSGSTPDNQPQLQGMTQTADAAPVAAPQERPEEPAPATLQPAPDLTSPAQTAPASQPAPAPVAAKPKAPPAALPPEASLLDDILGNPMLLPGAAALALVGLGGLMFAGLRKRRREKQTNDSSLQANSLFGSTGGQSVDTNNSVFNSNFSPSASQLDTNEVDPVAEADVYIAYGKDDQAEEILKEALRIQPGRNPARVKLLEIYARRNDAVAFEALARELQAQTKGRGEDWLQAAKMGAELDPDNPLYGGSFGKSNFLEQKKKREPADELDLGALLNSTQMKPPAQGVTGEKALSASTRATAAPEPRKAEAVAAAPAPASLDFALDLANVESAVGAMSNSVFVTPQPQADASGVEESAGFDDNPAGNEAFVFTQEDAPVSSQSLSFEDNFLAGEPEFAAQDIPPAADSNALDFDLSGINLELNTGNTSTGLQMDHGSNAAVESLDMTSHEMETVAPFSMDVVADGPDATEFSSSTADISTDNAFDKLDGLDFASPSVDGLSLDTSMDALAGMDLPEVTEQVDYVDSQVEPETAAAEPELTFESIRESVSADVAEPALTFEPVQESVSAGVAEPALTFEPVRESVTAAVAEPELAEVNVAVPMPNTGPVTTEAEMATKLDLAVAYREIGDKEGALELLEEVLGSGHAEFAAKAQEMLKKIA